MLLSELMAMETVPPIAFGVEVDTDMLMPPKGLRQIAFLYKGDADNPADDLIDAVISCTLAGIDTVVEFRPEDQVDMMRQVTIAGNAGYSIAAIPPIDSPEDRPDLWHAWSAQCAALAATYFDTPHFAGSLYPVSGFFGYMVARAVAGVEGLDPNDPYTRQRFVDAVPTAWADTAKEAMQAAWIERLGSKAVLDGVVMRAAAEAVGATLQLVDRLMGEQEEHAKARQANEEKSPGSEGASPNTATAAGTDAHDSDKGAPAPQG